MLNNITLGALPSSKKIHIPSKKFPDVAVAMREITLSPKSDTKNFTVYDTSGPYSEDDAKQKIDLNKGLPELRK